MEIVKIPPLKSNTVIREILEELLDRANRGELTELVCAYSDTDGNIAGQYTVSDKLRMLGHLSMAQYQLAKS